MQRRELSELVRQHKTDVDIYHDLMQFRVREILLVATVYDAFILEEEDRLTETIFGEYHQLNLSTAPRITSVSSGEEALETLRYRLFDMVILTMRIDEISPFELARRVRRQNPAIPVLLLLNDNTEIRLVEGREEVAGKAIDKIFVWNGDSKIFLAMIKYIEDKLNVAKDTRIGLVRVILLVEDSIRYYSRYLPILYSEIMRQTQRLIHDEGLNESKKLLRMRARPKVLMAGSFEEAAPVVDRYRDCLLALISDVSFPRAGARDGEAGLRLIAYARERVPDLPILLQSADPAAAGLAAGLGVSFLDKSSANLSQELTGFVFNNLGFGDFVFRDASGRALARAQTLERFKELLLAVPEESLVYHAQRNHFSGWLMARGEIQIARKLQPVKVSDFPSVAGLRAHLLEVYRQVQDSRTRGRIVRFDESEQARHRLIRLAEGSLGGKGRGMAFLHLLLQNGAFRREAPPMGIAIPRTWMIGTEEYEAFLERSGLAELFRLEEDYARVRRRFLAAELSPELREKLRAFLQASSRPLVVRSSGKFEDSLSQPFSGIYETYLLANSHPQPEFRLRQLEDAVKLVYASLLSPLARGYFQAINYKVEEERMAVVLQEAVGRRDGRWFYPHLSGVAQSYNYYPLSYLEPEEGIAVIAVGLGKYVIDGEKAFRFCPRHPRLDFLPPEEQLAGTQDSFYALDLERQPDLSAGEESTLVRLSIQQAAEPAILRHCLSVWDAQNARLSLDLGLPGPRIANFARILKYDSAPLAETLRLVLEVVQSAMGTPVEIEFAADLGEGDGGPAPELHVLQIKPLLGNLADYRLEARALEPGSLLLYSERAMGNGRIDDLCDLIYVDPGRFDRARTVEMAAELDALNARLLREGRRYILVGPGRWGSKDRWLGIPVAWNNISAARVIVEAELPDFKVDPSLGSHFFHNVTSMNIGYFDVPCGPAGGFIDWPWLQSQPAEERSAHLCHVRFPRPLVVKMDGRRRLSAVFKP